MSWKDKLNRLKELGRQQNIEYDIERYLEILEISKENVAAVKGMANTDGWEIISTQMEKAVEQYQKQIMNLCANPVKNESELLVCYSMIRALERVLGLVSGTLNRESLLEQESRDIQN